MPDLEEDTPVQVVGVSGSSSAAAGGAPKPCSLQELIIELLLLVG